MESTTSTTAPTKKPKLDAGYCTIKEYDISVLADGQPHILSVPIDRILKVGRTQPTNLKLYVLDNPYHSDRTIRLQAFVTGTEVPNNMEHIDSVLFDINPSKIGIMNSGFLVEYGERFPDPIMLHIFIDTTNWDSTTRIPH